MRFMYESPTRPPTNGNPPRSINYTAAPFAHDTPFDTGEGHVYLFYGRP